MSESTDAWGRVLEELQEILEGTHPDPSNGMSWMVSEIHKLCGDHLPPREMPAYVPANTKEQVKTLFLDAMARGDRPRVEDAMWQVGSVLGLWERRHPQSTPDYAIEAFAREAASR